MVGDPSLGSAECVSQSPVEHVPSKSLDTEELHIL